MAPQHPSAPSRASSGIRPGTARSGVIHVNSPHATHFTVLGNHLLQHHGLSATAIGLAAHIQSLPEGAPVGVKALAARFPEGEVRIASALRELERYGYLERRRERLTAGRMVTRTYSYNRPAPTPAPDDPPPPPPPLPPPPPPLPPPPPPPPTPLPRAVPPAPEPAPGPPPVPPPTPAPPLAPVPEPDAPAELLPPQRLHPGAADLLAGLGRHDPRLLLAQRDVRRLAPSVSAWLERGVDPDAVGRILSSGLPEDMRRPASVLAYRLTALLPPHLPPAPPPSAARRPRRPDPLQNCDGCDRAFRAPAPGRCGDCPPAAA
ncbi:helix-turn-helix domain-containing protein [Streptomyces virginiae]|uniref:helix-turn-helix domain-containing protein n=1 Tax=Streptomyces virginiae TaxID=1961 RepID=UPI003683FE13